MACIASEHGLFLSTLGSITRRAGVSIAARRSARQGLGNIICLLCGS
jgi:hypothetical protein